MIKKTSAACDDSGMDRVAVNELFCACLIVLSKSSWNECKSFTYVSKTAYTYAETVNSDENLRFVFF